MRSSLDKHRDIARSILPSRHRLLSRHDLPRARRRTRRIAAAEIREAARWVRRSPEGWLDYEGDPLAYDDEVPALVRHRRQGDKLNHFERWAVMSTRHLPREERMVQLRRALPDTLPGRHALGHLDHIEALGSTAGRWAWWGRLLEAEQERHEARRRHIRQLRAGLVDALEHGDASSLNQSLRRRAEAAGVEAAVLRSPADVEAILATLSRGDQRTTGTGRSSWERLVGALDEVVDGWRLLPPLDGPKPSDAATLPARPQSRAAGLSWLPPVDGGA